MTQGPAVSVAALVVSYGSRTAVAGVSFDVAHGEIVALLGPNGAGKTTTVETIEGYRRPTDGTVRVLGADPRTGGRRLRARIGLMLQGGGGVDPRLTPREVVGLYAQFHADPEDPDAVLERVGLGPAARTRVRRLSGGERARLALALALVGQPDVLLLDEPTAGLDPAARAATRSLVRSMADGGAAVLLTTHDLGDVERIADRVVIIHEGRVVAVGPPASIGSAGLGQLRLRLAAPVRSDDLVAAIGATQPGASVSVAPDGLSAVVSGVQADPGLVADLARWAAEQGVLITELHVGGASLEERYLGLTGDSTVERTT